MDANGTDKSAALTFILDDDLPSCRLIARFLARLHLDIREFTDANLCLAAVEKDSPDIVITDLRMPAMDGLQVLKRVKDLSPSTDVIIVTGDADKQVAIQALKLGAYDFFEKPVNQDELLATVQRTLAYRSLRGERDRFAEQVSYLSGRDAQRWGLEAFVGRSEGIRKILEEIRLLHRGGNASVLITGESGTGKELVARAIHYGGPRTSRPFVPVNCCAVPGELWESVFFGHMRGSFTGAATDKKGCFEVADQGTIFLDEIGDMPAQLQTKLLRVLEDGVVVPVGATKGHKVNVRVIASTNADLQGRIRDGAFRPDLYHRLAGFKIHIPPLRERLDDIPYLCEHFLRQFAQEMGMPAPPTISPVAMKAIGKYNFPGNVRELRNLIEQSIIRSEGKTVEVHHLRLTCDEPRDTPAREVAGEASGIVTTDLPGNLRDAEAMLIRKAMKDADGNVSVAARMLGINRTKLYRKLASLGDVEGGGSEENG